MGYDIQVGQTYESLRATKTITGKYNHNAECARESSIVVPIDLCWTLRIIPNACKPLNTYPEYSNSC
jgi:hypothetical protein